MKKKIIAIAIISMFLLTGLTTVSAVERKASEPKLESIANPDVEPLLPAKTIYYLVAEVKGTFRDNPYVNPPHFPRLAFMRHALYSFEGTITDVSGKKDPITVPNDEYTHAAIRPRLVNIFNVINGDDYPTYFVEAKTLICQVDLYEF